MGLKEPQNHFFLRIKKGKQEKEMRLVDSLCRQQVSLLRRIYKSSKKHHVRQRAHCILLSSEGTKASDLAVMFQKTLKTIYTWLNLWEAHRFVGLYHRKGRGRKPKLNANQKQKVKQWAKECPKNLKKIVALVKEKFGISVSKRTVQRILKTFGFSWRRIKKKPKGKPHPRIYAQKKEKLEELKEQEEQEKIDIYFFDEAGFCLQPCIPYAWQEKGETIQIESTKSKRLSVLGFLSRQQGLVAYTTEDRVDGEFVSACFDLFSTNLRRKTVVVLDNSPFHTSAAIEGKLFEWGNSNLFLFYLPKYSPQLNKIEILWRFMKYQWVEFWAYKGWSYLVKYVEKVICGYGTEYVINFV